jgi:hypothetical protein
MANDDLLGAIVAAIRRFQGGDHDLVAVQTSIVGNGSALEGASEELLTGLRKAEADLEFIQHAILASEQRSAALECLAELMGRLRSAGAPGLHPELPLDQFSAGIALDESVDTAFIYLDDSVADRDVARVVEADQGVSPESARLLCDSYAMFLRALAVLALPARHQTDWLNHGALGEAGICDELAEDFYQQHLVVDQYVEAGLLLPRSVGLLRQLNDQLGAMMSPGSTSGEIDALASSDEWQVVRDMAARCILTLK